MAVSADLAQSVEHFTRNEGVVGSIPIVGINPGDRTEKACFLAGASFLFWKMKG